MPEKGKQIARCPHLALHCTLLYIQYNMTFQPSCSSVRILCTLVVLCLVALSHPVRASPAYDPTSASNLNLSTTLNTSPRAFLEERVVLKGGINNDHSYNCNSLSRTTSAASVLEHRGGGLLPAGYHPLGYKITALGERFLEFGPTCLESDVGRLLASLKTKRKTMSTIQAQWLEIVRVSKTGQSMRIYRTLQDLIDFCLAARLID